MTNCFTRTEKQEEKTNGEIQETFFSIREQKIKKDAAGSGYLSDETIANRASDALLNYMEACYEKNGNLDAKAQSYWRAFRERAHPDTDYNKTIAATVMSEEAKNDWGEERLITLGNWSIQPCITSIGRPFAIKKPSHRHHNHLTTLLHRHNAPSRDLYYTALRYKTIYPQPRTYPYMG